MKIIYGLAAVSTILMAAFSIWSAYVTGTNNDQHKLIAFVLAVSVIASIVLYCIIFYRLVARANNIVVNSATDQPAVAQISKKQIYVGPQGMPVSIVNDNARVAVVIFSAVDVELRYMKVMISKVGATRNQVIMLESAEPMGIAAFDAANKKLERSLTPDELARLWGVTTIFVAGSANFAGGLEVTFTFLGIPFR